MSTHSTLICPQCRKKIPAILKSFKIAGCVTCGHVSALDIAGQLKVTHRSSIVKREDQEPFHLGSQLQYQKITYTVASVFVYAVDFREWDTEDSTWVNDKGYVKEWYAYDDQQAQYVIITKDTDGKFYVVSNPVLMKKTNLLGELDAKEFGEYHLWGFAGTDDEALQIKGHYRVHGLSKFECANEKFENAPILNYQLTRLSPIQVKRMVILEDLEKLKATEDFTTTTYYRNIFMYAFMAILVLLIFNKGMNEGRKQTSPYIKFGHTKPTGDLDTAGFKPQLAGTFDLNAGKNYQFTANCFLWETNQSIDYSLSLIRVEDATVVGDVALSFYTESGFDSEGSWEENLLHDQFKFQVDKTGKYQIVVAPDYENLWQIPAASLEIEIRPTAYTVFYLWSGAFFLLLFLIFQWRRENLIAFANLPHDTILHDIYESFS